MLPIDATIFWLTPAIVGGLTRVLRRSFCAALQERFKLPPEAVLTKLIHAVEAPKPKIRYYVTVPAYIAAWARRLLPQSLFDRFIARASDA